MHLFCLHHAGGTTASFAGWRFADILVTKLGYRGRDFPSLGAAADALAERVQITPSAQFALYGHSLGAVLAFEVALRLQHTGRVAHVFLAAARPPSAMYDGGAAATGAAGGRTDPALATAALSERVLSTAALSERAREVLLEDLALLEDYLGQPPASQLEVPATVLYSSDDPVVPALESRGWARWCVLEPRLIDVAGGGHLFHLNNPKVRGIVEMTLSPSPQGEPATTRTASVNR